MTIVFLFVGAVLGGIVVAGFMAGRRDPVGTLRRLHVAENEVARLRRLYEPAGSVKDGGPP